MLKLDFMIKRLFDVLISATAILVLSPIIALVTCSVARNMGTPVLFRQLRPGLNGKPFVMIKFRTMKDGVDSQGYTLPDSERLTKFGEFLRSSSLDELPGLWNVLIGDMSLVGPRPLLMEYLPLYTSQQYRRHEVRPGLTGWAQVNGRNSISWEKKFGLDVWYVDNRSLWLDIKILLLTIKKVVLRDGISSEGEATMTRFTGHNSTENVIDTIIGVYGASGFGREIMPLVKRQYSSLFVGSCFVFVDDNASIKELNGYPVLSYSEFLSSKSVKKYVVLAIANSGVRERLVQKCEKDSVEFLSVTAENAVVLDAVEIDKGAVICHFTQLTSNISIGKQFHANIHSYVAHDCIIGDYVTFAPGVRCNGNVHIEDHAYIGTGAIIKQGTPDKPLVIGKGAVIGMGAVVTKDVPPGITVIGNPARALVRS